MSDQTNPTPEHSPAPSSPTLERIAPQPRFTPGPWHWHRARTKAHLQGASGYFGVTADIPKSFQGVADLRLIEAAPDLYQALGEIAVLGLTDELKVRAVALLSKIYGGQS